MALPFMSASEAAAYVFDGAICGMGGFTPAGAPKDVPTAIAEKAEALHAEGKPFKIGMYTGASTGDSCDGALARAHAILFRTPYQGNKDLRTELNAQGAHYYDMHLSELAQDLRYGFMPKPDFAIIEACQVVENGDVIEIVPTAGVGNVPTFCRLADKVIVELNEAMPATMRGMHDIYEPADPPQRREIPIYTVSDRIGTDCITIPAEKLLAVVKTNRPNEVGAFTPLDEVTEKIGENVASFLEAEMKAGRIPSTFLPIQSGVGNVANAVLGALGANENIPPFEMYTEVIQDSVVGLMDEGRIKFASGCSLTIGADKLQHIIDNMDFFKDARFVIQCDRRNGRDFIYTAGSVGLCDANFPSPELKAKYGYTNTTGLMTDVQTLKKRGLAVACCNLSCGYYNPHTSSEYTDIGELINCLQFVREIVQTIEKTPHTYTAPSYTYTPYTGGYSGTQLSLDWDDSLEDDYYNWYERYYKRY